MDCNSEGSTITDNKTSIQRNKMAESVFKNDLKGKEIEVEEREIILINKIIDAAKHYSIITDRDNLKDVVENKKNIFSLDSELDPKDCTMKESVNSKSDIFLPSNTAIKRKTKKTTFYCPMKKVKQNRNENSPKEFLESEFEKKTEFCEEIKQQLNDNKENTIQKDINDPEDINKFPELKNAKENTVFDAIKEKIDIEEKIAKENEQNNIKKKEVDAKDSNILSESKTNEHGLNESDVTEHSNVKKKNDSAHVSEKCTKSKKKTEKKLRDKCHQASGKIKQNKIEEESFEEMDTSKDLKNLSESKYCAKTRPHKELEQLSFGMKQNDIDNKKANLRKHPKSQIETINTPKRPKRLFKDYAELIRDYNPSDIFEVVVPLIGTKVISNDDGPFIGRYDLAIERNRRRFLHDKKIGLYQRYGQLNRGEKEANKMANKTKNDDLKMKMENFKIARYVTMICMRMLKTLRRDRIDQKLLARYLLKFLDVLITPTSMLYVPHFVHILWFCRGYKNFHRALRLLADQCYMRIHAMFPIPYGYNFETVYASELKKYQPCVYEEIKDILFDCGDVSDILEDSD